jgi:signal recognition particle receptor subunit beta
MPALKVLITGPFNAGKTRFIRSASDVPPVLTEEPTFGDERMAKDSTTVALDYGMTVVRNVRLYLFGTPGQERFATIRQSLAQGMDTYITLVDSTDPRSAEAAREVLGAFATLAAVPYLIGATRADMPEARRPDELRRYLGVPPEVPVLLCNARQRSSVHQVLTALLSLPGLRVRS